MCALMQFAGLSSFPGLGIAQGLSNPVPFGQSFHSTGAFQPKVVNDSLVFHFVHEPSVFICLTMLNIFIQAIRITCCSLS